MPNDFRLPALTATTLVILCCVPPLAAAEPGLNVPPEGYRALFNGRDLAGWRGMGTDNPYQLAAKTEADRPPSSPRISRASTPTGRWSRACS